MEGGYGPVKMMNEHYYKIQVERRVDSKSTNKAKQLFVWYHSRHLIDERLSDSTDLGG